MGSPSSDEWLELGLGFKISTKLASSLTTSSQHNDDQEEEEEEEEEKGLDLRLQIGPKKIDYSLTKFAHFHHSSAHSSGLWFSLRSSPNRKGGAALPQIPKAYIRVNEKMTVLIVKKYLVTKLCLSNEAQVELWCMGERLVQSQSLKEVRDGVWLPKLVEFVNSSFLSSTSSSILHQNQTPSSTTTYLMCLYYGTTCLF